MTPLAMTIRVLEIKAATADREKLALVRSGSNDLGRAVELTHEARAYREAVVWLRRREEVVDG